MARRDALPGAIGIRDVARVAGVSQSSVSRVLSDAPFVSATLRDRVLQAVAALGYRPNRLARSLRSQVSRTIGFIVGDISNPSISRIVSGAEHVLREAGYSVLLADSEGRAELDCANVELLAERRVDGLLLSLCREDHEPTYAALARARLPAVYIDREPRRAARQGAVLGDHFRGMVPAIEHLLALGHRRIGFVGGGPVRPTRERMRALIHCYAEHGLAVDYRIAAGSFAEAHGAAATAALLDPPTPCTALVFGGSQLLVGGLAEVARRGLALPRDLSVVCCDDSDIAAVFQPRLSCVRRDLPAVGRGAADMLLGLVVGRRTRRELVVPTRYEPGASCAAPRAD